MELEPRPTWMSPDASCEPDYYESNANRNGCARKNASRRSHVMENIALDVHKHYTWARVENPQGQPLYASRLAHARGCIKSFVQRWTPGSPVAVETVGNWYWVVDEIEAGGGKPQLVNARLAKLMIGNVNKSDKLDAKGLNMLQRTGTLPTVWIPPSGVRDARELPRTRMVFSRQRTQLKNRVHATLSKYGYSIDEVSDAFGKRGRQIIEELSSKLPPHTKQALDHVLDQLDEIIENLKAIEANMINVFAPCPQTIWLQSLPGVGQILAVVIWTEIGSIERFNRASSWRATVAWWRASTPAAESFITGPYAATSTFI